MKASQVAKEQSLIRLFRTHIIMHPKTKVMSDEERQGNCQCDSEFGSSVFDLGLAAATYLGSVRDFWIHAVGTSQKGHMALLMLVISRYILAFPKAIICKPYLTNPLFLARLPSSTSANMSRKTQTHFSPMVWRLDQQAA